MKKIKFTETQLSDIEYQFDVISVNEQGEEIKRRKGKAKYFSEDLGNGVKIDMVNIPGGEFLMGSPSGEGDDREKPQHQVRVSPFYMGKFPITQEQWEAVAQLPQVERELKLEPSEFTGKNQLPVERVSWDDAVEFCNRLSKYTNKKYRLPTEAEWEYACRSVISDQLSPFESKSVNSESRQVKYPPFYFGGTITGELVNYNINGNKLYANEPKGEYRQTTTIVGKFPPNALGLYDMHGNVWEWCADNWHENYQSAPNDGNDWLSGNSRIKVRRGGSWYDGSDCCRSAYRSYSSRDFRFNSLGFRIVRVAPRNTKLFSLRSYSF